MECPRCGSENVTHSHRRGIEKVLRFIFPRVPYRCKECWSRFWKFHNPFQTMSSQKIVAGAFLLCLTAVAIVLVLSNGEKNDAKNTKVSKKPVAIGSSDTEEIIGVEKITPENTPPEFKADLGPQLPGSSPVVKPSGPQNGKTVAANGEKKPAAGPKGDEPTLSAWEDGPQEKPDKTKTVKPVPVEEPDIKKTVAQKGTRILKGIRQIDVEGDFGLIVTADGPVKSFTHHFIENETPPKFYIDLPGKWKNKMRNRAVKNDMIYRIRFGKHDDFLRIVFDLKKMPVFPELKESGEGMIIVLRKNK